MASCTSVLRLCAIVSLLTFLPHPRVVTLVHPHPHQRCAEVRPRIVLGHTLNLRRTPACPAVGWVGGDGGEKQGARRV
jgi:hypothetical protein